MPPKKIDAPEQKPLIGRVGTNLKVGKILLNIIYELEL